MLKNKIYNYFAVEIFKSFITILFAFSIVAWTVRAVNFLDLIVDNGHSLDTYFYYILLNITNVIAKFIPISFLFALVVSIFKFTKQNEFLIVWTSGLKKISLTNLFFFIAIIVTIIQLIFSIFITPYALNKSRTILKNNDLGIFSINIRENSFTDTFKGITFFIEKKIGDEIHKIYIKDESNILKDIVSPTEETSNITIIADKGYVERKKLVLFDGTIQTLKRNNVLEEIEFSKTELVMDNFDTRTIKSPKVQEMPTKYLIECVNENLEECPKNDIRIETLTRRVGLPLYIPFIALISSFLLMSGVGNKKKYFHKYLNFIYSFLILLFAELMVRFTGFSSLYAIGYFIFPIIAMPIIYLTLILKLKKEDY